MDTIEHEYLPAGAANLQKNLFAYNEYYIL